MTPMSKASSARIARNSPISWFDSLYLLASIFSSFQTCQVAAGACPGWLGLVRRD